MLCARCKLGCNNLLQGVLSLGQTSIVAVAQLHDRSGYPRVQFDRTKPKHKSPDYGYYYNYHKTGDRLPRLKDCQTPVHGPSYTMKDEWTKEMALMGQNDYIDILGDGSVHPAQLLYHVPRWLRGFPGSHRANELVRLIHYRNLYEQKMKRNMPKSYHDLYKRINYLIKYQNYHKSDEIRLERKLGIWKEEPYYKYKDKWNERWSQDMKDDYY